MKKIYIYHSKLGLVWGIFIISLGLQISCTPENPIDRNVQVFLQIPLPNPAGVKNASSIAGVKSVMLTVTAGNEILVSKELTILGNTANGTVSIMPGENIKFTAEARDASNIIQWQGSTTVDIVDDFTANIQLTPILPTANILKALEKERSVNLSWNQNSDPDFASYKLYRSQSASTEGTLLHSTTVNTETEYTDNLALEGNTYFYTLVVTDTEGFSTLSTVNINPSYPPTAGVLQGVFNGSVYLNWTQNPDSDFAGYNLYRSQLENVLGTLIYTNPVVTNRVYEDSKVSEGNAYFYILEVIDNKGLNSKSDVVRINVPLIPPTPSVLYGEGGEDGYVYLGWTQNYDSDFARYELYRSTSKNVLGTRIHSTPNVNELSYTDESVIEGDSFYYKLKVFDTSGSGTESNEVPFVMYNYPPTLSYLTKTKVSSNLVSLNWTQNYDRDFHRYELYRSQSDSLSAKLIQSIYVKTITKFEDTKVSPNTTYFYRLVVFDINGLSTKGEFMYVRTPE
ncbi:MAG: hypothetical protein Q8P34_17830 [Bacteroidota bacterium]|nr:hypothetical protein [Bacteroidota bacterium]